MAEPGRRRERSGGAAKTPSLRREGAPLKGHDPGTSRLAGLGCQAAQGSVQHPWVPGRRLRGKEASKEENAQTHG